MWEYNVFEADLFECGCGCFLLKKYVKKIFFYFKKIIFDISASK